MAKKSKSFMDHLNWLSRLPAVWAGLAVIGSAAIWFADLKRVVPKAEANSERIILVEKKTERLEGYVQEQREFNRILGDYITRKEEDKPPVIHPNGKFFWDERLQQWRPIRELGR